MKKRISALVAATCLLMSVALTGCGDDGSGGGFRFPLGGEPKQLDPQSATDTASVTVLSALFEGLTRLDENGEPQPGAADWSVSADGRTYTFTLRESYWSTITVRGEQTAWDEPTRVTAQDFVFGLQRAVSPSAPPDAAARLASIQNAAEVYSGRYGSGKLGVRATDENTLVITLSRADDTLLTALASPACAPCDRDFFEYTGGRYGLEKKYLLTNGAFALSAWTHNESLLLVKHEGYHDAARILPQAVRYVIGDVEDPLTALEEGAMDAAALTPSEARQAMEQGIPTTSLQDRVRSVYFNTTHATLGNADIRRALRSSVEWQTVYEYIGDIGEIPADGYIAPDALVDGEAYRRDDNARRFATDVSAASGHLGRGLAALGTDGEAAPKPRLTVLAAEDEQSANLARYLIQSWQKNLNVYCRLELVTASALASRVASGSYEIAIYTATATGLTGAENLAAYTTGAAGNISRYASSAFDTAHAAALGGGRAELDALEQMLYEDCPTLPLSFPQHAYGVAANTEGIVVRPFGGGVFGSSFGFDVAKKWDD